MCYVHPALLQVGLLIVTSVSGSYSEQSERGGPKEHIRAIYTGENKTRTARINGTKQALASYFRRDLHKTRLILEKNFRLFLFCTRLKEARKGFLQLMYASGQLNRKISCF